MPARSVVTQTATTTRKPGALTTMPATMWIIETDALPTNAMRIAGEVLGMTPGASQGGRLGTELVLGADDAMRVANELREYGYSVQMTKR
jgi:hypothetical protein